MVRYGEWHSMGWCMAWDGCDMVYGMVNGMVKGEGEKGVGGNLVYK